MFVFRRSVSLVKSREFSILTRNFRSAYDPKEIYKNPILNDEHSIPAPSKPDQEKFNGIIPLENVDVTYCKSSGPGGQHVNKIQTCAEVRFILNKADWIPKAVREAMKEKYNHRINKEGYFSVKSERTRSQHLNLADCLDKIRYTVREIEDEIKYKSRSTTEDDLKILEKKKLKAERRRLQEKRMNSEKKRVDED